MKPFITVTKKTLILILLGLILFILVGGQLLSSESARLDGSTNAHRMSYLKSIDISADDSAVTSKEIIIPPQFDEVYNKYNSLQKKSGFDLTEYKGEKATVYTYPLFDEYTFAHLIVRNGEIIGGDISSVNLDGEMKPLKN